MTCGSYSLKRVATDFASKHGNNKLKDYNGLKSALEKFFDFKGKILLHNERCFFASNFFGWLMEKRLIEKDPSRIYTQVS